MEALLCSFIEVIYHAFVSFQCDDLDVFDSAMKNKLTVAIKKVRF